jgi:hypothetical protein
MGMIAHIREKKTLRLAICENWTPQKFPPHARDRAALPHSFCGAITYHFNHKFTMPSYIIWQVHLGSKFQQNLHNFNTAIHT